MITRTFATRTPAQADPVVRIAETRRSDACCPLRGSRHEQTVAAPEANGHPTLIDDAGRAVVCMGWNRHASPQRHRDGVAGVVSTSPACRALPANRARSPRAGSADLQLADRAAERRAATEYRSRARAG